MPTVTLEHAQRFEMMAKGSGRVFDIAMHRPLALAATGAIDQNCPVLIVLDSALTFGTAVERSSMYAALGQLKSAIVVGVGYPGDVFAGLKARTLDLTPKTPAGTHAEMAPMIGTEFGGADDFLDFLLDELVPSIRQRAPEASESRLILHGFSLAGLFSAYALLTRPAAFETVSIIAPSLWWNGFAVLRHLPAFGARIKAEGRSPRVLVGVGALEQAEPDAAPPGLDLEQLRETVRAARMVDAAREFADALRDQGVADVEFACFADEGHAGALTAGTGRAVSFALRLTPGRME